MLDAVGAGELPDAGEYGDEGSNTLGNTARAVGGLDLPNLEALGLGKYMKELSVKKADFLAVNNDWGRGAVQAFGDLVKKSGAAGWASCTRPSTTRASR